MIILTLTIAALVLIYIDRKKYVLRHVYMNNMAIIYENMEIYLLKNNVSLDNNLVSFLKVYKSIIVNPELTDIDIFTALKSQSRNSKKTKTKINMDFIPEEIIKMSYDFNTYFAKSLRLSMLKLSFLKTCLFCSTIIVLDFLFHIGKYIDAFLSSVIGNRFDKKKEIRSIILNENNNLVF